MFGLFKKKTEHEKFLIQQNRLLNFHIPASEEVKITPKRDEQIQAAIKILRDLITEDGFTTKGWEAGWPRTLELSRSRSCESWQSRISIYCEIEVGGANWDRLSAPKFGVEFEADGYRGEQDDEEEFDEHFEKDRISLASIEKAIDAVCNRERKFITQFPEEPSG
jgi:hypothetical protein